MAQLALVLPWMSFVVGCGGGGGGSDGDGGVRVISAKLDQAPGTGTPTKPGRGEVSVFNDISTTSSNPDRDVTITVEGHGLTVSRTSVTVRAQVRERIGIQTDCGHANIDYDDEGRWSGDVRVTFTTSDASASLSVPVTCEGGTPAGDDDDDVPATSPLRVSPRDLTIEAGFGDSGAASAPLTIENVSDGEVTFTVSVDSRLIVSDGAAIELPRGGRATTTLTSNCRLDGTHDVPVSVKIDAPAGHAPLLVQVTLVCDRGTPPPELTLHPERLDMVGHFGDGAAEPATYPRASLIVYNGTTDSMSADLVPSNEVRLSTSVLGLPLSAGERNTVTVTGMCPPRPPADAPSRVYRMTLDVRAPSGTIEVPVTLACWRRPADLPQRPAFRVSPDTLGILPADTALPASEYFAVTNTRHDRRAIRVAVAAAGPYLRIAPTSVRLRYNETRHVRAEGACEVHGHFDHAVRVTATLDRDGAPEVHGANVQVALVCVAQDGAAVRGKPGSLRLVATRGPRKQDDNERAYYEVFDAVGVIAVHNAAGRPLPVAVAVDGGTADVLRAAKSRNPDTGAIETIASEAQVPLLEVSHTSFPPIHAGYEASLRVRSNCPSIRHEDEQTYKALLTLEPGGDAQGSTVEVFVVCPAIPRDAGTYGRITGPEPVALTATVLSLDGTSRHVAPYSLAGTASAPWALRIDVGTSPAMPSAPVPFTALSGGYLRLSSAGGTVPRGGRVSLRVETACPAGVAGEFYDAVELASSAEGVEGTFVQVLVKCAAVERDVLRVAPPGTLSVSGTPDAPSVITLTVYNKTVAPTARELSGVAVAVSGPGYLSATPTALGPLPSGNVLGTDVVLETQCDAEAARATPYRHVVRLTPTAGDGAAAAPHDVQVNVTCSEDVAPTLPVVLEPQSAAGGTYAPVTVVRTPSSAHAFKLKSTVAAGGRYVSVALAPQGGRLTVSPPAFDLAPQSVVTVGMVAVCTPDDRGVFAHEVHATPTFANGEAAASLSLPVKVDCGDGSTDYDYVLRAQVPYPDDFPDDQRNIVRSRVGGDPQREPVDVWLELRGGSDDDIPLGVVPSDVRVTFTVANHVPESSSGIDGTYTLAGGQPLSLVFETDCQNAGFYFGSVLFTPEEGTATAPAAMPFAVDCAEATVPGVAPPQNLLTVKFDDKTGGAPLQDIDNLAQIEMKSGHVHVKGPPGCVDGEPQEGQVVCTYSRESAPYATALVVENVTSPSATQQFEVRPAVGARLAVGSASHGPRQGTLRANGDRLSVELRTACMAFDGDDSRWHSPVAVYAMPQNTYVAGVAVVVVCNCTTSSSTHSHPHGDIPDVIPDNPPPYNNHDSYCPPSATTFPNRTTSTPNTRAVPPGSPAIQLLQGDPASPAWTHLGPLGAAVHGTPFLVAVDAPHARRTPPDLAVTVYPATGEPVALPIADPHAAPVRVGDGWRTERVVVGGAELHAPGAVLRVVVGPGQPLVLPLRGVMPQPVAVTWVPVALVGTAAPAAEAVRNVRRLAAGHLPAAVLGTAIGEAIEATDLAGAWAHLYVGRARNAAARNELHFGLHGDGALPPRWSADGVMLAHDGGDGGLYASLLARAPWVPEPIAPAASVRLWDAERLAFTYPGEARHAALLAGDVAQPAEATGMVEELAVPAWGPPRSLAVVGTLDAGGVTLRTAASPLPPWPAPDAGAWSLTVHSDGRMHREPVAPVATDGDGLTWSARVPWPDDPDAVVVLRSPDGDVRGEWGLAEVLQ